MSMNSEWYMSLVFMATTFCLLLVSKWYSVLIISTFAALGFGWYFGVKLTAAVKRGVSNSILVKAGGCAELLFSRVTSALARKSDNVDFTEELTLWVKHCKKDFVSSWYTEMSNDEDFPEEVCDVLLTTMTAIVQAVKNIRIEIFLQEWIAIYHGHLATFIDKSSEKRYARLKLHSALTNHESDCQELEYLREVSLRILQHFCEPRELIKCKLIVNFLPDVLSKNLCLTFVDMMSDEKWINYQIIRLFSAKPYSEQEQISEDRADPPDPEANEQNTDRSILQFCDDNNSAIRTSSPSLSDCTNSISTQIPLESCVDNEIGDEYFSREKPSNKDDMEMQQFATEDLSRHFHILPSSPTKNILSGSPEKSGTKLYETNLELSQKSDDGIYRSQTIPCVPTQLKEEALERISINGPQGMSECSTQSPFEDLSFDDCDVELGSEVELEQATFFLQPNEDDVEEAVHVAEIEIGDKRPGESEKTEGSIVPIADMNTLMRVTEQCPLATRIFHSVFIPDTVIHKHRDQQGNLETYTLYSIKYQAWFLVPRDGRAQVTLCSSCVHRRYREFVTLHAELENCGKFSKQLKRIRPPSSRWTLPFGNMKKDFVEERRKQLVTYLTALCQHADISLSAQLHEFLGYGSDASIAYVRKPMSACRDASEKVLAIPRVLTDGVVGVIDRLLTVLPGSDQDGTSSSASSDSRMTLNVAGLDADIDVLPFTYLQQMSETEGSCDNFLQIDKCEVCSSGSCCDESMESLPSPLVLLGTRSDGDGCDREALREETSAQPEARTGLAESVIELAALILSTQGSWLAKTCLVTAGKQLLQPLLNSWFDWQLSLLTSGEQCLYYMQTVRAAIWPQHSHKGAQQDDECVKAEALRCLENFFPVFLKLLAGKKCFRQSVQLVFNSLQYPLANRHLVYKFIDLLLQHVLNTTPSTTA